MGRRILEGRDENVYVMHTHVHMGIERRREHLGDITWALGERLVGSKIRIQETIGGCFCVTSEN